MEKTGIQISYKWLKRITVGAGVVLLLALLAFDTIQAVDHYTWRRAPGWQLLAVDLGMRSNEIQENYNKLVKAAQEQEKQADKAISNPPKK